jgi:hypothetical protein
VKVVQHWSDLLLAEVVVAAATNDDCRVDGQEGHWVTEPGTRRFTLDVEVRELTMDDSVVHGGGLEVAKLVVVKFAVGCLTAEVVNAVKDLIRLKAHGN